MQAFDFLLSRRSVPSRLLGEPGPDPAQLEQMLALAVRVPDHGRLEPWRFVLVRGDARQQLGEALARRHGEIDAEADAALLDKDRQRFATAPLIVVVTARIIAAHRIPEQEQLLSAGLAAYNLMLGAHALGFAAQWLTGWAAYDEGVARLLGLEADERIVAFVHVGSSTTEIRDRPRPAPGSRVREWAR